MAHDDDNLGPGHDATQDLVTYQSVLAKAGVDVQRLVEDSKGTIVAAPDPSWPSLDARALDALPVLVGEKDGERNELKLKAAIGKGGMGQILRAEQTALLRDVAVKCAIPGGTSRHEAADELLREGRVTGALEHPNIVPVHTLGKSADGEVLLVMKRIEGRVWTELLRARTSTHDELERHLRILMDVCRAVHFAHARGVLHRDLKPDNVMVGSFGEVYVLDWGLAVVVGDRAIPGVKNAADLTSIAGTPGYMAPEMAAGGKLDQRSDVYLLGGVLHAILTGRSPHGTGPIQDVLLRAFQGAPPVFTDDVPVELADICRRALAKDPRARFASAEELRAAIDEFLSHASARAMCAEAERCLALLEDLVAGKLQDDAQAHRAFHNARFAFDGALRSWPASKQALRGISTSVETMARYELGRRHLDAAAVLVSELQDPPPDVVRQLEALRAELADEEARRALAEKAAADADHVPGRSRRGLIFLTLGALWALFGVVAGTLERLGHLSLTTLHITVVHVAMLGILSILRRFASADDRRVGRDTFEVAQVALVGAITSLIVVMRFDGSLALALAVTPLFSGLAIGAVGAFFDKRLRGPTATVLVAVLLMLAWPSYALDISAVGTGLAFVWVAWLWRR